MRYLIGIDEAGRGALAGPISVGAVLMPSGFDWRETYRLVTKRGEARLRDSKQLTAQQRDILYEHITSHGRLEHACAFVDAKTIDTIGVVRAAHQAAASAVGLLGASPQHAEVLLDAGLKVPPRWTQQAIVRGDETVPAIALASIVAKVTRDRFMENLSGDYGAYQFARHKGYGTFVHRRAIVQAGLSDMHRASFCRRLRVA